MLKVNSIQYMLARIRVSVWYGLGIVLVALSIAMANVAPANAQAGSGGGVQQVSTGDSTTCAVKDYWAYCWGSNANSMLGTGKTDGSIHVKPAKVAQNKEVIPEDKGVCKRSLFGWCLEYSRQPAAAIPASAMAGHDVQKISVGKNHVCAIADAQAFCWGSNSKGQLGTRSNSDAKLPVAVDTQQKDVVPAPTTNKPCGGWFQPKCKTIQPATISKSALGSQEVIDIVAGDEFTCALTSEGKVACWGEGSNGRLGNGDTKDVNYPVYVYDAAGSPLAGKRGTKLSKASGNTVCVVAVDAGGSFDSTNGIPYCWGYGMGSGAKPVDKKPSTVACSKTSGTSVPGGTSKNTYFDSSKPVRSSDAKLFSDVDANNYITGLGVDQGAYQWGMHGYSEVVEYTDVKSCVVTVCTGYNATIKLSGYTSTSRTTTQRNNTGGTSTNTNHYSGRATPGTTAHQGINNGGGGCSPRKETHYGWTKINKFVEIGSVTAKSAPVTKVTTTTAAAKSQVQDTKSSKNTTGSSPRNNTASSPAATTATTTTATTENYVPIRVLAGNVVDGMFCGVSVAKGAFCDTHGGSMDEGQTGSGYEKKCTTTTVLFIFKSTTCEPAPKGPQAVVTTTGWLKDKTISSLSTSPSGYTCAVAGSQVGCWGVNSKGQLGVGDTKVRKVPTVVSF